MAPIDAVRNTCHLSVGEGGLEEGQLAGAGVTVAESHAEDGAVVLGDDEAAVVAGGEIGQIAVFVEHLGDDADLLGEGETNGALAGALQAALGAAIPY